MKRQWRKLQRHYAVQSRKRDAVMDDTDRLIAAMFAATMTARLHIARIEDFWASYDACMKTMEDRSKAKARADKLLSESWDRAGS